MFERSTQDHLNIGDEIRSAQGIERELCPILNRRREAKLAGVGY
jgi:hypothetical protein